MNLYRSSGTRTGLKTLFGICALAFVFGGRAAHADEGDDEFEIRTLSTRADMVSGSDVVVQVNVPARVRLTDVRVDLNGGDVTDAFRPGRVAQSLVGLVKGLALGHNTLTVISSDRGRAGPPTARLTLVNHPITGPIFSGPHQAPFICQTKTFVLPVTGGTLGPPLDGDCSINTRADYVYMSTAGVLKPLPDSTSHPADLAMATRKDGRTFNYIVRVETGTINRAIYQMAVLHDPTTESIPSFWTRPAGWNSRLLYSFGGGCGTGYHQGHHQGSSLNVLNSALIGNGALAEGYAIAASSLNVFGVSCNDVISAETMMMVKEHFIKTFGIPDYTIGVGASGGSMQQHMIAFNYPGLLDGINPARSFPDTLTFEAPYQDCDLLGHAFAISALPWTLEQKTAVAGQRTYSFCTQNTIWAKLVQPNFASPPPPDTFPGCDPSLPAALRYDVFANPTGTRCTLYDNMINVYGRSQRTGFARRPIDNLGVQYGLGAFNAGTISVDQFLDLNARIGGYDIDGNYVPARTVADREALRIAYRTGRVNSGRRLDAIPIIDSRAYRDNVADVHDAVRSHVMRARLIASNGHADNQIIVTVDPALEFMPKVYFQYVMRMDEWLGNTAKDSAPYHSAAERLLRNKPSDLVDACYTAAGDKITAPAVCRQLHPPSLEPRLAAGEPLANDILKCSLKPVNRQDYVQALTDEQFARLKANFPQGVCDYSRRGVEQQLVKDTWLSYPLHGDDDEDENEHDD
jgi:hypothetical protein